jgi:peptidoglycan/xylan/chitin deacetylase (PgdA/CDA1 family)
MELLGVASTFVALPRAVAANRRGWANTVEHGHEIGNHTVFRPCNASNTWSRGHALQSLTLADMRRELQTASAQIRKLLGVDPGGVRVRPWFSGAVRAPSGSIPLARSGDTSRRSHFAIKARARRRTAIGSRPQGAACESSS